MQSGLKSLNITTGKKSTEERNCEMPECIHVNGTTEEDNSEDTFDDEARREFGLKIIGFCPII